MQPYMYYPQMQPQTQIQNGGFISVQNEAEARAWAVAAGTSVTFKDENAPYCYTKTMGFSQLDQPRFEKYRLVKEEPAEPQSLTEQPKVFDEIRNELEELRSRIARLEKKPTRKKAVVVEEEDEDED